MRSSKCRDRGAMSEGIVARAMMVCFAAVFFSLAALTSMAQNSSNDPIPSEPVPFPEFPDRRPVMKIPLSDGNPPIGMSTAWYEFDDISGYPQNMIFAEYVLRQRIEAEYADGWRRFILNLPAGFLANQAMSGNQWTALTAARKAMLTRVILSYVTPPAPGQTSPTYLPGARFGIYSGGVFSTNPASLETLETATNHVVSFHDHLDYVQANALPYAAIGCTEFFLDASAYYPAELVATRNHSSLFGIISIGGEAIPLSNPGTPASAPNWAYIPQTPWVANATGFVQPNLGNVVTTAPSFSLTTTEIGLILDYYPLVPAEIFPTQAAPQLVGYTLPLSAMKTIVGKGYIPWSGPTFDNPIALTRNEHLKRIYSFGKIKNIADFNDDGQVTEADQTAYLTTYFAHEGTFGNYIHGDMNADNWIDPDDLGDFITAYVMANPAITNPPVKTEVNFGGPNPEYAHLP